MKSYIAKLHEVREASEGSKRSRRKLSPAPPPDHIDVFTLGEVAQIVGAPKARIKNWTIGRPLKVIPKVLAGKGKGSRNLFALEDVYLMALVNRLRKDGISSGTIQDVIESAQGNFERITAIVLFRRHGKWDLMVHLGGSFNPEAILEMAVESPGVYVLDFKLLVKQVKVGVAKLRGRETNVHIPTW